MKKMSTAFTWLLSVAIVATACTCAVAIEGIEGLASEGSAKLKKEPTHLKLSIELSAKGKSTEEAAKNLDTLIANAKKKLTPLNPVADSVKTSSPTFLAFGDAQKAKVEQMLRARMQGSQQPIPAGLKMAKVTKAKTTLSATWELKTDTLLKKASLAEDIKTAITNADLPELTKKGALSAAQEEAAQEMAARRSRGYYSDDEEVPPGTPRFFFSATISEEEREKLIKEAFEKAKANAEQIARVTGVKVGKVKTLAVNSHSAYSGYDPYGRRGQMIESDENEQVQPDCVPMAFQVHARVLFAIEE